MYGHAQPMNMPAQIGAGDSDDGSGAGNDIDGHHIQYETHALDDGSGGGGVVGGGHELSIQRCDDSSQLTLSFRGQVYVFDSVTPDKVRFLLNHTHKGVFTFILFFYFISYC